jgi:hypothetical protein
MSIDLENLEQQNTELRARNAYLENVVPKMIVMIKNASDVCDQFGQTLEKMTQEMQNTRDIYTKLHNDLHEAFSNDNRQTGLSEPD